MYVCRSSNVILWEPSGESDQLVTYIGPEF